MSRRLDVRRQFLLSCVEEAVIGTFLVAVLLVYAVYWVPWVLLGLVAFFVVKIALFPWHQPVVGVESMIGKKAVVMEDLDPEGMAKFDGILWVARSSEGPIPSGEKVVIREVSGSKLHVAKASLDGETST
jgi:membrane-bound ClpP family serine protease